MHAKLMELRDLLAARGLSHGVMRPSSTVFPTGIPAVDAPLGGLRGITELVCTAPSCGGQLVINHLLTVTRSQGARLALIDGGDTFDPDSADAADALVWVRCRKPAEAMQAADVFVRDTNFAVIVMDLRADGRGVASSSWYRLQRALEQTGVALVVITARALVPCAELRFILRHQHGIMHFDTMRSVLARELKATVEKKRAQELAA